MKHTFPKSSPLVRVGVMAAINAMAIPTLVFRATGGDVSTFGHGFRAGLMAAAGGADVCASCEVGVAAVAFGAASDSATAWLGTSAALAIAGAAQKDGRRLLLLGAGIVALQAAGCVALADTIDRMMSDGDGVDDGGDDPDEEDCGPTPKWN